MNRSVRTRVLPMLLAALLQFVIMPLQRRSAGSAISMPSGTNCCCVADPSGPADPGEHCCEQCPAQPTPAHPGCHCNEVPDLDPLLPAQTAPKQQDQDEDEDPPLALIERTGIDRSPARQPANAIVRRPRGRPGAAPPLYLLQQVFQL